MAWDFWSLSPEALHQITILFSDRGTPDGYRHMDGFSSHTYKWVNAKGEVFYVKYHFKTDQGIKNLTAKQADELKSSAKDYATLDLFNNIADGNFPSWTFYV
jgi:catalase